MKPYESGRRGARPAEPGAVIKHPRLRRALVAALAMAAIGSAARSPANRVVADADPSTALNGRTPVPALVMSTLRRSCFDCHSDETRWPWYATLPMAAHLIERDVAMGRGQLNLSRWTQYNAFARADMLDKICELASSRAMPPWQYRALHPAARLATSDVSALCAWSQQEAARLVKEGK